MANTTQMSPRISNVQAEEPLVHVLWINCGLSCDGDSVALTAATSRASRRSRSAPSLGCRASPSTGR